MLSTAATQASFPARTQEYVIPLSRYPVPFALYVKNCLKNDAWLLAEKPLLIGKESHEQRNRWMFVWA